VVAQALLDHANFCAALSEADEGVDAFVEIADFSEAVDERASGSGDLGTLYCVISQLTLERGVKEVLLHRRGI
jgi:hypothetical protein